MRRFVIGDIHGAYKALKQCLQKSAFNNKEDLLICLGDICDGWPETRQCIDELLKVENRVIILGNHDRWALDWMTDGKEADVWLSQGGRQTKASYNEEPVPDSHIKLLSEAALHYTEDNKLFVHAGIDPLLTLDEQDDYTLLWDRDFYFKVVEHINEKQVGSFTAFEEVYIGHTPIHRMGFLKPVQIGEVWLMDTGAAWQGTLSMMDIDSREVFISDRPVDMYPGGSGRF